MYRTAIFPTVLAALGLGVGAYHHVEIGRLHARIAQLANAPAAPSTSSPAVEIRLRALEARAAQLSSSSPAPASAVAGGSPHQDGVPAGAAAPPAARRGGSLSPAEQRLVHETGERILDAAQRSSLDVAENRQTWIRELATAQGLSADETSRLGSVFEAEFQRREAVIAEVKNGARTRQDGRAELRRLEASSSEQARAILGADRFKSYLARRVASGIHDDGSAR
ncbi:MAG TPA: hypothetical protein VFT22_24670 [Kofleriaceae bacterium]|nr:hypothetical protein [Kofleriaceae bacterium]